MIARKTRYVRWLVIAHLSLAAGDTIEFAGFLLGFLIATGLLSPEPLVFLPAEKHNATVTAMTSGIVATSITMSFYFLFLGLYCRDKFFDGRHNIVMMIIYFAFAVRIAVHFNPGNVWLSSQLPENTINYTSWLRNIPLFAYATLVIALVGWKSLPASNATRSENSLVGRRVALAMLALAASFAFYGLAVFFAHLLPHPALWLSYIFKTIAYVAAGIFIWWGEFRLPVGGSVHIARDRGTSVKYSG